MFCTRYIGTCTNLSLKNVRTVLCSYALYVKWIGI